MTDPLPHRPPRPRRVVIPRRAWIPRRTRRAIAADRCQHCGGLCPCADPQGDVVPGLSWREAGRANFFPGPH